MFSIRTLLLVVAIIAVGVVGLTTRNVWWASVMSTLTWLTVAAALICAIVCGGKSRWLAIGFCVGSALYLVTIFMQPFQPLAGTLFTTRAVIAAWRAIDVPKPQPPTGSALSGIIDLDVDIENVAFMPFLSFPGNTNETRSYFLELRSFFVVAHCLWTFFFGFLGALLAGYLARERLRDESAARGIR
jgi:hypothetical protein